MNFWIIEGFSLEEASVLADSDVTPETLRKISRVSDFQKNLGFTHGILMHLMNYLDAQEKLNPSKPYITYRVPLDSTFLTANDIELFWSRAGFSEIATLFGNLGLTPFKVFSSLDAWATNYPDHQSADVDSLLLFKKSKEQWMHRPGVPMYSILDIKDFD